MSTDQLSSDETVPLLEGQDVLINRAMEEPFFRGDSNLDVETVNAISVLPLAFLAALGMAATAATSIFAYASLLCKEPTHCQKSEQSRYAKSVALAVTIANVCGLLVLGSLEKLSRNHRKVGLALWVICRSLSVVVLAVGVYSKSIAIALSGRVFEGLASDNFLHFNLNAIYVRVANKALVSRFIGASLAFFMIGISISPAVAGLFHDFVTSFFMAIGIFAFSLIYLLIFAGKQQNLVVQSTRKQTDTHASRDDDFRATWLATEPSSCIARTVLSPLQPFYTRPASLLSGISILFYNSVQSYIFSLIMVHNSLNFQFSGKQNGQLLSIVHAVSASYLFLVLFGIPEITRRYRQKASVAESPSVNRDAVLALVSLTMQVLALLGFANATRAWEVYVISAFLALGLSTPSFIKSHFIGFFKKAEARQAIGALTMMETIGGLLSPLILGFWQTTWPGTGVFYTAAGMVAVADGLFCAGAFALYLYPVSENDDGS